LVPRRVPEITSSCDVAHDLRGKGHPLEKRTAMDSDLMTPDSLRGDFDPTGLPIRRINFDSFKSPAIDSSASPKAPGSRVKGVVCSF
jgi:hypothetical protein